MKRKLSRSRVLIAALALFAIVGTAFWALGPVRNGSASRAHGSQEVERLGATPSTLVEVEGRNARFLEADAEVTATVLHVLDSAGVPVASALAWCGTEDHRWELEPLGSGSFDLSAVVEAEAREIELLVRAPGFLPRVERRSVARGQALDLHLSAGARIAGVVVGRDGVPAPGSPFVLAYPEGFLPTKRGVHGAIEGQPSELTWTRAGSDGFFMIDGLPPGSSCCLIAGGGGVATPKRLVVPAGDENVLLMVDALFGLRVVLDMLESRAPSLWERPGVHWTWDREADHVGLGTDDPLAILAGLGEEDCGRVPIGSIVLLFSGDPGLEQVGPIDFAGTPAGYEPLAFPAWAPRYRERLEELHVVPQPRTDRFGGVRIRFEGLQEEVAHSGRTKPLGRIEFDPLDGATGFTYSISGFEPVELASIPAGDYAVTLDTESGYANHPCVERRIHIEDSAVPVEVTFDLRSSCTIEATISRAGSLHLGEAQLSVQLDNEQGRQRTIVAFQHAPYVIDGLIPGRYRLSIYKPFRVAEVQELELSSERRRTSVDFDEGP